ncbi:hypothetical protein B7486_15375 [cyanobacterium TDX16]|nr:hypothetical protein B7486_15375 [cyanobacterium TDX16]
MSPEPTIPTAWPGPQTCGPNPIIYSLAPQVVFTKNHQKVALPQLVPATCVGTVSARLVSPYVTLGFERFGRGKTPAGSEDMGRDSHWAACEKGFTHERRAAD